MNEFTSRQYNNEEVNRIIRRALKLEQADAISHQDLIDTAREIGIDPKILETAILQEQQEFKKEKIRKARLQRCKVGFYSHLFSYLTVNAALLLINNFTPGPWWFQWSVLGWGIGLAFHFKAIFFSHGIISDLVILFEKMAVNLCRSRNCMKIGHRSNSGIIWRK